MPKSKYLVLLFIFLAAPVFAAESKPSPDSIKKLLTITDSRKLVDNMTGQMDEMMKNAMQQALQGQTVTPKQQKVIDDMQTKTVAVLKEELNWESLEPLYIQIYSESFSQEEIDGMLAFYETPAGQALIKKMPVVMQKSMVEMQKRMGTLMQKLQKIQQDALSELKKQSKSKK